MLFLSHFLSRFSSHSLSQMILRLAALLTAMLLLPAAAMASPFPEGSGEEFSSDAEKGLWFYRSPGLTITITRKTDDTPLIWYEAEIFASPEQPLYTCISSGTKKPGRRLVNPMTLARENNVLFAISDDFCGYRLRRNLTAGIIIREGQVLSRKTFNRDKWRTWPNLDTLAVFPDGRMKTYLCDQLIVPEYQALQATNVFAFGPILVSEGEINPWVLEADYYPYKEPRMAIGMIEPFHYMVVAVEGRKKASEGATPAWLARKMQELGCVEALNLDGGGTAVMIFMGQVLNRSERNLRSINSIIGFGRWDWE